VAARRARVLRDQQDGGHALALRRHLIAVTQRLLAAHGLAGLTTRAIAREAQVADGVLYNHFSDKDELVIAAVAERVRDLVGVFLADCPRAGGQDLPTGLLALARLCLGFQVAVLPLAGGLVSRPDLVRALIDAVHSGEAAPQLLWGEICDFVAAEQELGNAAADVDPNTVAEVLFGACQLRAFAGLLTAAPTADPAPGSADPHPDTDTGTGTGTARDPGPDLDRLVAFLVRALRVP